jgi:hypothetical protein
VNAEAIANRFLSRDGLQLRYLVEIALPVYRLRLRAVTVLRKGIPPIEEFVLRSIALDIGSMSAMSAFLGLEDRVLRPALVSLVESGDVSVATGTSENEFLLTSKGKISSEKHILTSTEERAFPMFFDALARKAVWHQSENLIDYKELKSRNLREVTQYPSVRPRTADLRLSEIDGILKSLQHSPDITRDLVAIRGIEACRKLFQPAVALVYSQDGQSDLQLGVVIDGKLSPVHERAVWQSHGFSDFVRETLASLSNEVREIDKIRQLNFPHITASTVLKTAMTEAQSKKSQLVVELATEAPITKHAELRQKVELLEAEITRLSDEARLAPVKNLYMQDHAPLLENALKTTKVRLLIIAPWVRANVVDTNFIQRLKALLELGVIVHIGHGFAPNYTNAKGPDEAAKAAIESLAVTHSNLHFVRLGNTHAKVLIKDEDFAAITSFNWLSFSGDPTLPYRDEQGVLFQRADLINAKYDEVMKQFP